MNWIVEQPLPTLFVGILVEAALLIALLRTTRGIFLYWMAGVGLVVVGLLAMEHFVVTHREEVENTLYQIARDVKTNDPEVVVGHVSPKSPKVASDARGHMRLLTIEDVRITGIDDIEVREQDQQLLAKAKFNIVIVGGDKPGVVAGQSFPVMLDVTFERADGRWLVREYKLHSAMGGKPIR